MHTTLSLVSNTAAARYLCSAILTPSLFPLLLQLPRHDPINLALGAVVYPLIDLTSEAPADTATITVTLRPEGVKSMSNRSVGVVLEGPSAGEGAGLRTGTWAVLKKQAMNERIKGRWDLSFPSLQPDSSIPTTVSKEFAVMSEAAEITTALLAPATAGGSGLKEILEDAETSSYLKSLVVSRSTRPSSSQGHYCRTDLIRLLFSACFRSLTFRQTGPSRCTRSPRR